jgi:16S rRNA (adenine1518-N6/adenine1519-N6)-dimethyltransferase
VRYEARGARHVPRKRFGQHFLVDPTVVASILEAISPQAGDHVVEIGPGLGALTEPLLQRLPSLDAVEVDRDLAAALAARFGPERLRMHVADALQFDFCALGAPLRVVGNLPYNISTPLLFHLAGCIACLQDCHFMLQREVVERIAAKPGGKDYGRLSVMLQYRFEARELLRVAAGAFRPVPAVESTLVRLTPRRPLPWPARDEGLLAALVAKAFTQRRKTLRNALRDRVEESDFYAAQIDPGQRPEALSVAQFVRLADVVSAKPHT